MLALQSGAHTADTSHTHQQLRTEEIAMTSERHEHYRAALTMIADVGPSKLHAEERDTLTDCAEDLLLSDDLVGVLARRDEALALLDRLVVSGRWLEITARRLGGHIEGCGPAALAAA